MSKALTDAETAALRKKAKTMKHTLIVGREGAAENIVWGLNARLGHEQLVKVKFNTTVRAEIQKLVDELCARTNSVALDIEANMVTFYKPHPNRSVDQVLR